MGQRSLPITAWSRRSHQVVVLAMNRPSSLKCERQLQTDVSHSPPMTGTTAASVSGHSAANPPNARCASDAVTQPGAAGPWSRTAPCAHAGRGISPERHSHTASSLRRHSLPGSSRHGAAARTMQSHLIGAPQRWVRRVRTTFVDLLALPHEPWPRSGSSTFLRKGTLAYAAAYDTDICTVTPATACFLRNWKTGEPCVTFKVHPASASPVRA
jgi:hypothetical protein